MYGANGAYGANAANVVKPAGAADSVETANAKFSAAVGTMNQLQLWAEIVEREAMRYTPAGIPIINAKLRHASQQFEAGVHRLVEVEVSAIAAGGVAAQFEQLPLGMQHAFSGFLARKNRNSKTLVFHIIDMSAADPRQING